MRRGASKTSVSGYPYREAVLVPASQDITKTWYIKFYVWDITTNAMVRKRVLKDQLAAIPDLASRLQFANECIDEINYALQQDYHMESTPAPAVLGISLKGYSLIRAIEFAINYKKDRQRRRKATIEKYDMVKNVIEQFLAYKKLPPAYPLKHVNAAFIDAFMQYLQDERKIANKTYNLYRGFLHTLFETLIKKDPSALHKNPVSEIEKLIESPTKNAAFSEEQLQMFIAALEQDGLHQVTLFIRFIYYTLARPDEIRHIRVGNIDLAHRRILIRISKTKEDFVAINDRFCRIIEQSGVLNYPGHYYVFSNDIVANRGKHLVLDNKRNVGRADERSYEPGEKIVGEKYFYKIVCDYLERLKFYDINPNYTLYSFKHTGAIGLYRATKDIKLLQTQCRHQEMATTIKYLRDLGIFTDYEKLNDWTGPI